MGRYVPPYYVPKVGSRICYLKLQPILCQGGILYDQYHRQTPFLRNGHGIQSSSIPTTLIDNE